MSAIGASHPSSLSTAAAAAYGTAAAPDPLDVVPHELPIADFDAFSTRQKRDYLERHLPAYGTGDPEALVVGTGFERISVTPGEGGGVNVTAYEHPGYRKPPHVDDALTLFPTLLSRVPEGSDGTDLFVFPGEYNLNTDIDTLSGAALDDFIEQFRRWHSAAQIAFVQRNADAEGGLSVAGASSTLNAFVNDDASNVIILESVDKASLALMSRSEQDALTKLDDRTGGAVSARLGLSSLEATVFDINGSEALDAAGYLTRAQEIINTKTMSQLRPGEVMPSAHRAAFTDQLDILKWQLENAKLVNAQDLKKKVTELMDRFERAFAFMDVATSSINTTDEAMGNPNENAKIYTKMVTSDGDISGIARGYSVFIAQEMRLAEIAQQKKNIVLSSSKLDVPMLVYMFQNLYNSSLEAHVVMETEEINQQNDLLKTYAAMQDLINRVLSLFEKSSGGNQRIEGSRSSDDYPKLPDPVKMLIGMFDVNLNNKYGQRHPLEVLNNISRPTYDMVNWNPGSNQHIDLNARSHPQWSVFGTRLSETVTLINQNSQLMMNDVNSLDKQRNRHFELANNSLAKMSEILQNIARG